MVINPVNLTFKSNISESAPVLKKEAAAVTIPLVQNNELQKVMPSYTVAAPSKYTDLGKIELYPGTVASMYKLESGQRVVIVPKAGSTVVKTYVDSGSMNETDEIRGISHFIEHNLFNGSDGLEAGEFFKTVNKMGASTNASTSFAVTDYYVASHLLKKSDLENSIKIHASMLQSPRFAINMLEKEKGPVTSEINMIMDNPYNLAYNNTLKTLYNINSTSTDIIAGTVSNVNNLTREKVVDYYNKNYFPSNMVTVITGEVEPNSTMQLVSKYFKPKKVTPQVRNYEKLTPITKTVRKDIISEKATSTIVNMGFNGPANSDLKSRFVGMALSSLLTGSDNSRLSKELEKYQTSAIFDTEKISIKPEDGKVIMLSSETSENNSEEVLKGIYKVIATLENNPPTEQEMYIVKNNIKRGIAQLFDESGSINGIVGNALLNNNIEDIASYNKIIDKMTAKDLVDFSKKYLNLNKTAITVIHPESATAESIKNNYKLKNQISFTGNADEINHKTAVDVRNVKMYKLQNNLMTAVNDDKAAVSNMYLDFSAAAPANVKPGVVDVLSLMLSRGTKFRDEKTFLNECELRGIDLSFDVDEKGLIVGSSFDPSKGVEAARYAKEAILYPRFTQENLDYSKKVIKEYIETSPVYASEGLLSEVYKGLPYGVSSDEVLKNLDNITMADVQGLHKYFFQNAKGSCVISAPFEKNPELKNSMLNELSRGIPQLAQNHPNFFQIYKPVESKKIIANSNNNNQAEILMGYKFKRSGNMKDSIAISLLNNVLGGTPSSRLFSDLRETQKLAYRVNSSLSGADNAGLLTMSIKTTTDNPQSGEIKYDNLQKSINGFEKHVNKLMVENITEEELENAKLDYKNRILDSTESLEGRSYSILSGFYSYYGTVADNQRLEMVDKITVEDVKAAANYIFNSNPTISIVATKNTIENNKEFLKSKGNLITDQ